MLDWTRSQHENNIILNTMTDASSDHEICRAVEDAAERAIEELHDNIQDASLYLLFEWCFDNAELKIAVTDVSKSKDSPISYCCKFTNLLKRLESASTEELEQFAETLKFWLHDYLSSCTPFLKYSLVAIFHQSTREHTELL